MRHVAVKDDVKSRQEDGDEFVKLKVADRMMGQVVSMQRNIIKRVVLRRREKESHTIG